MFPGNWSVYDGSLECFVVATSDFSEDGKANTTILMRRPKSSSRIEVKVLLHRNNVVIHGTSEKLMVSSTKFFSLNIYPLL